MPARMPAIPSMSICKDVPWRRRASAPACADASMHRLSRASADASHAGVAGMSDLVAAMHGDYAAGQIVIARLLEAGGAQHLEQSFLIRMHADGFSQISIAGLVPGNQPAEQRQHLEGIGVVNRLQPGRPRRGKLPYQQLAAGF